MPFKHAHYFILALFVAAGFAFWRDYLAVLQSVAFVTVGGTAAWRAFFVGIGQIPAAPWLLSAFVVGVAVTWLGWNAGRRPVRRATATEAA